MTEGQIYSTVKAENDLTMILSKFDSDYVMDIINYALCHQSLHTSTTKPNAVYSLDIKYCELCLNAMNNGDTETINILKSDRNELYMEIIDYICNYFNIDVDRVNITTQNIYSVAFWVYDIFINYYHNTVLFMVDYILRHRTTIYDVMSLNDLKKNKDTSTIYNKKLFKNNKMAIIVSNLEMVIDIISNYNISFLHYLTGVYNAYIENKSIIDMITSIISPNTSYFSTIMNKIMSDNTLRHSFISDVRVALSNNAELTPGLDISNYIEYEEN